LKKFARINNIDKPEYKVEDDVCSGLNRRGLTCSNKPTALLKVKYINKSGFFCQQCTTDLLQLELAEEILSEEILNV